VYHLYRQPGGEVWYARIPGRYGRYVRKSTKCRDRKAAQAVAREFERQYADPSYAASHAATLHDVARHFVQAVTDRGRATGTLAMYEVKIGHLRRVIGTDTKVGDVTARTVDDYIATRREEGASASTIGKELTALRGILKVAKRRGEFTADVAAVMPVQWSSGYKPRRRFLSVDETGRLLAALPPHRAAMVAFMVATGAEWGAAQRAQREDVAADLSSCFLRGTKRSSRERTAPITTLEQRFLLAFALVNADGADRLFSRWGNVRRGLQVACAKAGIAPCSPNDLRRTFGKWLRALGVAPNLIGAAMGHADSRMVERVYGRLTPEELSKLLTEQAGRGLPNFGQQQARTAREAQAMRDNGSTERPQNACTETESNRRHGDFQSPSLNGKGRGKLRILYSALPDFGRAAAAAGMAEVRADRRVALALSAGVRAALAQDRKGVRRALRQAYEAWSESTTRAVSS